MISFDPVDMALVGAGDVVGNGTGEITDLGAVLELLLKLPPRPNLCR